MRIITRPARRRWYDHEARRYVEDRGFMASVDGGRQDIVFRLTEDAARADGLAYAERTYREDAAFAFCGLVSRLVRMAER